MENELNSVQALCKSGCGFFGSPATDGHCSSRYKENLKKQQSLVSVSPARANTVSTSIALPTKPVISQPRSDLPNAIESNDDQVSTTEEALKSDLGPKKTGQDSKMKNRCVYCRKKVGLLRQ